MTTSTLPTTSMQMQEPTMTTTTTEQEDATGRAVMWLLRYVAAHGTTVPLDVLRADSAAAGHSHPAARRARRMLGRCYASPGHPWTFTFDPSWAAEVATGRPPGPLMDRSPRSARLGAGIDGRALDRKTDGIPVEVPPTEPVEDGERIYSLSPLAQRFVDALLADPANAYLTFPGFRFAVRAWGRAEAWVARLETYIAGLPVEDAARSDHLALLKRWKAVTAGHRRRLMLAERPILTGGTA